MKKYFLFSAGVSLLFGLIVGNLCSETEYYLTHHTKGTKVQVEEDAYNDSRSVGKLKKFSFNYSYGVQASIGIFALSMIGYSFTRKIK